MKYDRYGEPIIKNDEDFDEFMATMDEDERKRFNMIYNDDSLYGDQNRYYLQCKDCKYWNNGDVYSNSYDKANCQKYPSSTNKKPLEIYWNLLDCKYKEKI